MVVHACNSRTGEVKTGGVPKVPDKSRVYTETLSQKGVVWENGRMSDRGVIQWVALLAAQPCDPSSSGPQGGKRELTPESCLLPSNL